MKLEEISSVVAHDCYGFPNHVVRNYIINLKNGDYFVSDIRSILKDDTKEIIINDIKRKDEVAEKIFTNKKDGNTLVKFNTGRYGYYQKDGNIAKYRFDYATEFNEAGLAIVCMHGEVYWMTENFKFLMMDTMKLSKNFANSLGHGANKIEILGDTLSRVSYTDYSGYNYETKTTAVKYNQEVGKFINENDPELILRKRK